MRTTTPRPRGSRSPRPWTLWIALAAALSLLAGAWQLSRSRTVQLFGEITSRVVTSERVVALTFDDGPVTDAVDRLLPVLRERGVRATFFVTGAELEANPELGRLLVREGHELGNHSYSHVRMVLKTPSFVAAELERTDRLIRDAGHTGPIHFRPPFGKKLIVLPYVLSRTGRRTVMWDVEPDSDPVAARSSARIVGETVARVRPGSIILLHVMYTSRAASLEAVPQLIDALHAQGYRFITVAELLARQPDGR